MKEGLKVKSSDMQQFTLRIDRELFQKKPASTAKAAKEEVRSK